MNSNCPVPSYFLQHTPGENHFANSFQCSASHQPVERWTSTGGFIQPKPNFPPPSSTIRGTVIPLGTAMVTRNRNRWQCPICLELFPRRQERDRHELKHVPYFIHCPLPHCAWRGNRTNLFKKHWRQEDHCSYHEYYGRTPGQSQIETFDPWLILNQIIQGAISLREGEDQAIFLVQMKACELHKLSMLMDPWGRNKRHLIGEARTRCDSESISIPPHTL
ncbi:hypothetical protein EDB92DRAFT_2104758 [Lactarius akahatsu]|uniref:C2H2-type domain-containing protein n=1 Tax=Lactarius akahatsu TaxID=416441 RepID=A0AAD4QBV0_9AGAM|nr:hypothetical protein EDB92DRAFT_2104758 [Lactarius akahatsu]